MSKEFDELHRDVEEKISCINFLKKEIERLEKNTDVASIIIVNSLLEKLHKLSDEFDISFGELKTLI